MDLEAFASEKLPLPFERMNGPEIWKLPPVWHIDAYRSLLNSDEEEELRNKHRLLCETCEVLGFERTSDAYTTSASLWICALRTSRDVENCVPRALRS